MLRMTHAWPRFLAACRHWNGWGHGRGIVAFALLSAAIPPAIAADAPATQPPDFARDVRSILSNRCFKCHGPDAGHREAGLRFDRREEAIKELESGHRGIVPGHPADSEMIARINSTDSDVVMPPPSTMVPLSDSEKATLARWVADGAEYQPHWAFLPPLCPTVPDVHNKDGLATQTKAHSPSDWGSNAIDQFILARLQKEGLAPAAKADPEALCRRVHLDLIGLPPSPAELESFVADPDKNAYEKLVEKLLASPRYGERWARRWLDLARYADTNGYEKDRERSIWMYRDWVIRAMNEDMPFDQFTIRQLAGDLLPQATTDDIIATGFHRNTMINEEGGIDPLEFRYLAMVDRVATTGTTWLGLTTGCAQCHTHKFDPIEHTDYFSLMALLDTVDEPVWVIPSAQRSQQILKTGAKIEELWTQLPSQWPVPPPKPDAQQSAAAAGEPTPDSIDAKRSLAMATRFDAWNRQESALAIDWKVFPPAHIQTNGTHLVVRKDGSILGSGDTTKSDLYEITLPVSDRPLHALRLEVLPDESLPGGGPGLCWYEGEDGDFLLSEIEVMLAAADGSASRSVTIVKATESYAEGKNNAAAAIDGNMTSGWSTNGSLGRSHAATFQFAEPVVPGTPLLIRLRFERYFACSLGCFRLSVTDQPNALARGHSAAEEAALLKATADRSLEDRNLIMRRFWATAAEVAEPIKQIRQLQDGLHQGASSLVMRERPADNPRKTHRHHRGEYLLPKEVVTGAVPAFLPQLPQPLDGPPRLAFAKWLVSPANPLTARVTANRQWQAFFGRGIVSSLDDFGYQSQPPSHPELLDWLASELVRLDWSIKSLHRLIVNSDTYQQASAVSPELMAFDRENVLVARGPRVRLEAEVIRDSLLKAAGLLSEKMYGPGVRPPQPAGVTEVVYGNNAWKASTGEDRYRRSIYTFAKRTAPFAMTTTFDAPSGESCLPKRDVSNSALQALTLLNDPMFVEIAQALSEVTIAAGSDDASRLRELSRRVLSRDLNPTEMQSLADFVVQQRTRLAAGELNATALAGTACKNADPVECATWMLAARAVMNLDEAVVKQ